MEEYMPRRSIAHLLFLILGYFFAYPVLAGNWHMLAPGIEYQDLNNSILTTWSHIHAFRIDLKNNKLALVRARDLSRPLASANDFAQYSKALITINGGFFDQNNQPLGLRISDEQQYSPLKRISWWGIFYIKQQKAYLSSLNHYSSQLPLNFAIQSGPRLIANNKMIAALKQGYAERSALGITHDGHVIILVTENAPMTTSALAALMHSEPVNCRDALNLDGGSSSQLSVRIGEFALHAPGFSNIADAIVVKPV
jgi:uncharacterized protein YigE (DUF2233 family)